MRQMTIVNTCPGCGQEIHFSDEQCIYCGKKLQ